MTSLCRDSAQLPTAQELSISFFPRLFGWFSGICAMPLYVRYLMVCLQCAISILARNAMYWQASASCAIEMYIWPTLITPVSKVPIQKDTMPCLSYAMFSILLIASINKGTGVVYIVAEAPAR